MTSKRKAESQETVFHGEQPCAVVRPGRPPCTNKAYYRLGSSSVLACGVHSRNAPRRELPVNPNKKANESEQYAEWERAVEATAAGNRAAGRRGTLTVSKLRMMRAPEHVDGVRNVFPNNRHQDRRDGFGCASLSPMRLGPTEHWQPGLPQALSIENYHQFNKVFRREVTPNPADPSQPIVSRAFFEARNKAYLDPQPYRRKFADEKGQDGNRNIPLFCLHLKASGEEGRYSYVESRYFYCREYERLAKATDDFARLRRWLDEGYNLQIVGYDGHPIGSKSLYEHYVDPVVPFGHELVLYTLLTVERAEDYPWNVYFRENRERYE